MLRREHFLYVSKISAQEKISVVKRYLNGLTSQRIIANERVTPLFLKGRQFKIIYLVKKYNSHEELKF